MNYNQLINAYLDGTLEPEGESQLFMALSSNENLRNELKQTIDMDKAMSKRVSTFVPSSASTLNIFSQLGIGAAVGATSTVAAVGVKQALMTFITSHSQAIITAFITFALTAGGFLAFYYPNSSSDINFSAKTKQTGIFEKFKDSKNSKKSGNQAPTVTSIEGKSKDTIIKFITKYIDVTQINDSQSKTINVNKKDEIENLKNSTSTENNADNTFLLRNIELSKPEFNKNMHSNYKISNYNIDNNYEYRDIDLTKEIDLGLSVELKGNGYWSALKPEVPQYSSSILTNMQLSALYKMNKRFSFGFDIRQESFYQKFHGVNDLGEEYIYKQYPSYISLGLIGRYSFWGNDLIRTYSQLGIGATITGAVGRIMLGFEFMPWSDISFNLGVEGSNLIYLHQKQLFNSPKIGLSYGVAFNF